jgi:uncharacterized paraquat-inducible protein A
MIKVYCSQCGHSIELNVKNNRAFTQCPKCHCFLKYEKGMVSSYEKRVSTPVSGLQSCQT